MKPIVLVAAAWLATALTAVLGVAAAGTIWFYMEPVVDLVDDPASYYVAVVSGFAALGLSFAVSLGLTIHVLRCSARTAEA
ncbi:hypothetical protein [Arthrobacter sp. 35W]|uniref:hypothetical protein n=1 Tax=Arthrobacter sp. 35W TaxID=1132441 RepID=UPI00041FE257|nr:hypothetical protein [Arthrobacter sp. 35W]